MTITAFDPEVQNLIKILGLDGQRVMEFSLVVKTDEPVHVVAKLAPTPEQIDQMAEVLKGQEIPKAIGAGPWKEFYGQQDRG